MLALALPCAAQLREDERAVFFPSLGYRVPDTRLWEVEIRAWVFEPESRRLTRKALQSALGLKSGALNDDEKAVFAERARAFLVDNERGKRLSVRLADRSFRLAKSAADGHVVDRLRLRQEVFERWRDARGAVTFSLEAAQGARTATVGQVHLLEPHGLSVISDIDDTIKVSHVANREALLRNTFCRPFTSVPGMAAVYQAWARNHRAQFHYVSASPWQLYPALSEFTRTNEFPEGTWHLKKFRWKDESFFGLFASPEAYKLSVLEPLLKRFPQRRFVLVGDSGERDPEIYGQLARRFPRQIARVFIRDVTSEPATAARYERAFSGLAPTRWRVFATPQEIADDLESHRAR